MASNCHTRFGMAKIPADNPIRAMLDPVDPSHLQPCFDATVDMLRRRGGLASLERLRGRTLIALDGTEYFCSQRPGCAQCLTRKRAHGKTESCHTMLAATIVAPGNSNVVPLMPVPGLDPVIITPQDGHGRQRVTMKYQWFDAVPRRDGKDAMVVNWIAMRMTNAAGKVTFKSALSPRWRSGALGSAPV